MTSFNKTFLALASGFAGMFLLLNLSACKQLPSPPYHGEDIGTSVPINYASFYWKDEEDFKRISEYFTDEENPGNNITVRSNPESRSGLYMILNLESGNVIPAGSVAELRYFHPKKSGIQTCRWTLPEFSAASGRELRLGLTGGDWERSLSRKRPSAWQISATAPDGTLLFRRDSYLWKE